MREADGFQQYYNYKNKKIITKHKQTVAKEEQVCVCGGGVNIKIKIIF